MTALPDTNRQVIGSKGNSRAQREVYARAGPGGGYATPTANHRHVSQPGYSQTRGVYSSREQQQVVVMVKVNFGGVWWWGVCADVYSMAVVWRGRQGSLLHGPVRAERQPSSHLQLATTPQHVEAALGCLAVRCQQTVQGRLPVGLCSSGEGGGGGAFKACDGGGVPPTWASLLPCVCCERVMVVELYGGVHTRWPCEDVTFQFKAPIACTVARWPSESCLLYLLFPQGVVHPPERSRSPSASLVTAFLGTAPTDKRSCKPRIATNQHDGA